MYVYPKRYDIYIYTYSIHKTAIFLDIFVRKILYICLLNEYVFNAILQAVLLIFGVPNRQIFKKISIF